MMHFAAGALMVALIILVGVLTAPDPPSAP